MNASSKGVAIGIYKESKNKDYAAGSTQPFVELMGRNPVLEKEDGQWRGIVKGAPVDPAEAFGYIQRSFRQTVGAVIGAMRLLAQTFGPGDLNTQGYGLYCDFRPSVEGWGKKSEMRMQTILGLRRAGSGPSGATGEAVANKTEGGNTTEGEKEAGVREISVPGAKRRRGTELVGP
ncbi:hypothetical protein FRB99_000452 [Tulasnella sp. 403]|nr:hypothetical protein FRB99_000452 [Tulasnella sp. 403]